MVVPNATSREQAYLNALASQPKDIVPERIYKVSLCQTIACKALCVTSET